MRPAPDLARDRLRAGTPPVGSALRLRRRQRRDVERRSRRLPWICAALAAGAAGAWLLLARSPAGAAQGWAGAAPSGFSLGGDLPRGKRIYRTVCAGCHGPAGDGHGESAIALDPNLSDQRRLGRRTDWELYRIVRDGGVVAGLSPAMAGVKNTLADGDIRSVTAYIRTLAR
jgi:high-affinity iron transporter